MAKEDKDGLLSEEDLLRSLSQLERLAAGDMDENLFKSDRSSGEKEEEGSEDDDPDKKDVAKNDDDPEDNPVGEDPDDDPFGDPDDGPGDDAEDVKKSLQSEIVGASEPMRKAIEVSDFLEGIVEGIARVMSEPLARIDRMEKSLAAIIKSQNMSNELIAKSLGGVLNQVKDVKEDFRKSLGEMGRTSAGPRKSVSTAVLEKSFVGNGGADSADKLAGWSSAQKTEALTSLLMKGHKGVTVTDVVNAESTGIVPPHLEEILRKAL